MKDLLRILTLSLCVSAFLAGCGEPQPTAAQEKETRDAMSGKTFDPSKAPPEARAMIEKMNTKGSAPAPSTAAETETGSDKD